MRILKILVLMLLLIAPAHALGGNLVAPTTKTLGLRYVSTPNITYDSSRTYTVIEAQVENTGFETIFISLPKDWDYDPQILSAKGEPVVFDKPKLHRKYGSPRDRYSFITNHFVFWQRGGFAVSRGAPLKVTWSEGGYSWGWFTRPNERLVFTIKMKPNADNLVIDPFAIEQNRSDIRLIEWNQEFYLYPENVLGFIAAPWIVKNATLVEATPGIFANLSGYRGGYYYSPFKLDAVEEKKEAVDELNPPAWDEWTTSSGMFNLKSTRLASPESEFLPIPELNETEKEKSLEEVFVPVWYNEPGLIFIRYRYEWQLGKVIKGVDTYLYTDEPTSLTDRYGNATRTSLVEETVESLDLTLVPDWYNWF